MNRRRPRGGARRHAISFLLLLVIACSHRPPADFAPDPGLVARIRTIEVRAPQTACPGANFPVTYTAVLTDGSRVPFAIRYDRKDPPALHVVFLERSSAEAIPLQDGGWAADRDPLVSVRTGFRLDAALRANPSIRGSATIAPSYECMRHAFAFSGRTGATGASGEDGPSVTVRLALGRSPFYSRLIVAGVEVADAPPFYVLADGSTVPPADWLLVTSRGGDGGSGPPGRAGQAGTAGSTGCPAGAGGPGGPGGSGGHGGSGGRGGSITIIASAEEPFLAGLVDARSPGGPGGQGGAGGKGGPGGAGGASGQDRSGTRCPAGPKGSDGASGASGRAGPEGDPGPRPRILTIPSRDVFGPRVPPDLVELFAPARRRP